MDEASIKIPFEIGETVWFTGYGVRKESIVCPECMGNKVVTLIQGNGEEVSIDCACCGDCWGPSRGRIEEMIYDRKPEQFTPRRVDVRGNDFMYSEAPTDANCYVYADSKSLFHSFEECEVACRALNEQNKKLVADRLIRSIESKRKSMAWSVHYWGRKVNELERELDAAKDRLSRCKPANAR